MPKLLLPIVAILAVGGSAAGASVYLLTRDDTVEEVPPSSVAQASPTPSPAPTAAPTPTPEPTLAAEMPTATATAAPVPDDWTTYTDPDGLFTLRYPPTWFESDGSFSSRDPATFKGGPDLPADVVEVEVSYYEALGSSGCGGALLVDPETGEGTPQAGATPASLDGLPAWQITREAGDPAIEGGLTRIQAISLIYKGFCFNVAAYFTQQDPDVETFLEIARTFKLAF